MFRHDWGNSKCNLHFTMCFYMRLSGGSHSLISSRDNFLMLRKRCQYFRPHFYPELSIFSKTSKYCISSNFVDSCSFDFSNRALHTLNFKSNINELQYWLDKTNENETDSRSQGIDWHFFVEIPRLVSGSSMSTIPSHKITKRYIHQDITLFVILLWDWGRKSQSIIIRKSLRFPSILVPNSM